MSQENKKREIMSLEIDKIDQLENSRITYGLEDMSELMQSMKGRGLLSPIGVRPNGKDRWEVVFGNRRLVAAKKLDWKYIDAVEADAPTDEDMLIVNAVENMQRADVPFAEQGRTFVGLIKRGLSYKEIAARIGISPDKVKRVVESYRKIPTPMRRKVIDAGPGYRNVGGKIPATTAHLAVDLMTKHRLPKPKRDKILQYAQKPGVTTKHVQRVAGLVRTGRPLAEAIKEVDKTRIISITLAVPIERIEKLENQHGKRIHDIVYEFLAEQKWLGVRAIKEEK